MSAVIYCCADCGERGEHIPASRAVAVVEKDSICVYCGVDLNVPMTGKMQKEWPRQISQHQHGEDPWYAFAGKDILEKRPPKYRRN